MGRFACLASGVHLQLGARPISRGERKEFEGIASLVAVWKARCIAPIGECTRSSGCIHDLGRVCLA